MALLLAVVGYESGVGYAAPLATVQTGPKNIIFILTDDQPDHTLQFMPRTNQLLGAAGVNFTRAYNSSALCCPSRASSLTGKYAHNTNIVGNLLPWGSAALFQQAGQDQSTIATWLHAAGYRTYFVGKYLNEYGDLAPYQPPGWDQWHAMVNIGTEGGYQDWYMIENGTEHHYSGSGSANYSVNVLRDVAIGLINATPADKPLFLYFSPSAPHRPATPDPADAGTFSTLPNYRPPSYNEADVSDKPAWIRNLDPITATPKAEIDALYHRQVEALQSVDRAVEAIVQALQATGRMANTAIVYTSDNGYSLGEHRWERKECVYQTCTHMPLLVRAPGVTPRVDDHLMLNIDLPATFAEWAGLTPPAMDGSSFAGLLLDPTRPWRDYALLETLGRAHSDKMNFQGLVTRRYLYAEYVAGDRELYDLNNDPYELVNVYTNPDYAAAAADLHAKLMTFKVPADLQLSVSASAANVVPGGRLTYTIGLTNQGPSHSASVFFNTTLPSQLQFVSCASTANGVCTSAGSQRLVRYISVASGAAATITLVVTVSANTPPGTIIQWSGAVSGFTSVDPNPGNNSVSLDVLTVSATAPTPTPTPTSTADTQPPSVTLTAPLSNAQVTANSTVTIKANAADTVGIARVDFFVNTVLTCSDQTSPYACSWLVPGGSTGTYALRAKAVDTSGNVKNAQITVTK
jgi:N-acetylglucosamine-6-sulfatase